jgi:uncharacterized repeat protein (TIGR01451 family)
MTKETVVCISARARHYMERLLSGISIMAAFALLSLAPNEANAQDKPTVPNKPIVYVSPPVAPYTANTDLRTLPKEAPTKMGEGSRKKDGPTPVKPTSPPGPPDPVWQKKNGAGHGNSPTSNTGNAGVTPSQFTSPSPSFGGMTGGGDPPDTNGSVGPNHFIQTVNQTFFFVWDKQGNGLAGPTSFQSLWAAAGAPANDDCRVRGRGDPYVTYDHLADRWVLSQLANHLTNSGDPLQVQCIAVSKGPNPVTDGWYAYTFLLGVSNDYPKLGVWPDGYYLITQEGYNGNPLDATVFDRANMLNGNPATFQRISFFAFTGFSGETVIALPSELTGPLPPTGSPNFYVRPVDGALYGDGSPRLEIWEFHVDWGVPANTTFKPVQTLTPATFRSDICAGGSLDQDCVPMPGTTNKVDAASIWPRSPVQYRNFTDHETLMLSHGVNLGITDASGNALTAPRWYELRRSPPGSGSWTIQQQSTFSPTDTPFTTTDSIHRWNSSIAMDKAGNIAMSYNVSSDGVGSDASVFPGISYVGRLVTDPPGEMTTPEVALATGTSAKPGGGRWGDYSMIRVDPSDGCTFWTTNMYFTGTLGNETQNSQVGAFRFPTCNPADLSIGKTGPASVFAGNQLTYTITVTNNGTDNATNVIVTDTLPAGVTFLATSAVCTSGTVQTGCNIGSLANGATVSFTIQIRVPANFLSSASVGTLNITNTVTVSSDQFDPNTSNNTATATTNVVESADLSITKVCKPDTIPAVAGTTAYCTMTITDNGPSDAQKVSLTDAIAASTPFTIVSVTPTQGFCTPSGGTNTNGTVNCTLGTIAAGSTAMVTVNFTALNGGNINDTASVSASTPDPNTANNTATGAVTYASSADVSITKTSAPNPVVAGTNLTYTITAHNAGPSTATNVVVKDTLPAQVAVVSATPSAGSCSGGIPGNPTQPLTCTLGSLNSGASATITVVVLVNSSVPNGTILINNASIASAANDPNNANNIATANSPVVAQADLAIVKTSDKPVYKPSSVVTYTIKVTNNGPSDALAVIVTDNLPTNPHASYQSDTGGCTKSGLTLTCNLGTMPTGTSKSFNVYELVQGNPGSISNTASVTSSTSDVNAANNTSTLVVAVK